MPNYAIRSLIRAPKGKVLINCDLSQAESWIVAYLSGAEKMKEALLSGVLHETTASAIHEIPVSEVTKPQRYNGKQTNHATGYRMKPPKFAQIYNKNTPNNSISIKQATMYQLAWHRLYPEVKGYWWPSIEEQLNKTRALTTPYGFRRVFYQAWGEELFKEATAFVPQSTVAHHFNGLVQPELGIRGGLLEVKRQIVDKYPNEVRLINQAHDSAMLEVPSAISESIAAVFVSLLRRPVIVNGSEVNIPVDCEIGERWGELGKVKVLV